MALKPSRLFVDTWGWLVLADAKDPAHEDAIRVRRSHTGAGSLVTTDYVLDQTITRLFSRCAFELARRFCERIFAAQTDGLLSIENITPDRFQDAWKLRIRYRDKQQISFTDLTSFVVMKELHVHQVLTADAHFMKVRLGFRILP